MRIRLRPRPWALRRRAAQWVGTYGGVATSAQAEVATATATANNASMSIKPTGGLASATATANNAVAVGGVVAGAASATATAYNASVSIKVSAGRGTATATANDATAPSAYPFVTSVSGNGRYLLDQYSDPILMNGLSVQLIQLLTTSQMDSLVSAAVALGINAFLSLGVSIGAWGVDSSGHNANGDPPWPNAGSTNDITSPNDAYWDHIETFVDKSAAAGITVILNIVDNVTLSGVFGGKSAANCRTFGQAMGTRFASKQNLIWSFGVDWNSADYSSLNPKYGSILRGLRDNGANQMHTLWLYGITDGPYSTYNTAWDGTTDRGGYVWEYPDINFGYTYYSSEMVIKAAYQAAAIPTFLGESHYWNERNTTIDGISTTTRKSIRKQNGRSFTYGGLGGGFPSSDDIWTCSASILSDLAAPVFADVGRLYSHIASLDGWHLLEPDYDQSFITSGNDAEPTIFTKDADTHDYITASVASDNSLALLYVTEGTFTVDLTEIDGTAVHYWFDPTSGDTTTPTTGQPTYPGNNDGGDSDWLLVFQSASNTNAAAGSASATASAYNASVSVKPNSGVATSTATANNATKTVGASAGTGSATATAQTPSLSVKVSAGAATVTASALNATISTSTATNAAAGSAAVTGTAYNAAVSVKASAGTAAGTVSAYDCAQLPTVTLVVSHAFRVRQPGVFRSRRTRLFRSPLYPGDA